MGICQNKANSSKENTSLIYNKNVEQYKQNSFPS